MWFCWPSGGISATGCPTATSKNCSPSVAWTSITSRSDFLTDFLSPDAQAGSTGGKRSPPADVSGWGPSSGRCLAVFGSGRRCQSGRASSNGQPRGLRQRQSLMRAAREIAWLHGGRRCRSHRCDCRARPGPRFAELAAAFDDLVGKVWSWRSAWLDDTARPTRREEVRPDRLPSDR